MSSIRPAARTNVVEYLLDTATRHGARRAIETVDGHVTYLELLRAAHRLAATIGERSGARCRPVAILARKGMPALAGIAATLMSGNIYCPVDVGAPHERIAAILDSLGDALVLADDAGQAVLDALGRAHAPGVRIDGVFDGAAHGPDAQAIASAVRAGLADHVDLDPCYIIFTSGSTGMPKGVTIPHRGVLDYIDWANDTYEVGPDDRIGSQAPLFFDNSTLDLYLSWSNGAAFHLIPEKTFAFPKAVVDHLARHAVTTIFWVPSVLAGVANLRLLDNVRLPALRQVLFAGEVMPAGVLSYWMNAHPNARYANLYGPTEITVDCTHFDVPRGWNGDVLPIGVPCRNAGILVLDEHDRAADEGELCVRGSGVALGYWNDPERTAAAFVQNPLHDRYHERIYRTGDLVRRKDGLLYFIGRKDHQIKHNGYRIELGDIEAAAAATGQVDDCVAGYDSQRRQIYLALVAPALDRVGVLRLLAQRLPKYMLPARIEFFVALPLMPNLKVDRKAVQRTLCVQQGTES